MGARIVSQRLSAVLDGTCFFGACRVVGGLAGWLVDVWVQRRVVFLCISRGIYVALAGRSPLWEVLFEGCFTMVLIGYRQG